MVAPKDQTEQMRAERIINRFNKIKGDRGTLDSHLQEVAERVIPRKSYVTTKRQEGSKVITFNTELFDATAVFANQDMAAGLISHLMPPNSRWFALRAKDPELNKIPAVKESLAKITTLLHEELAASNFYNVMYQVMIDLGWAGQACVEPREGKKTTLSFGTYHISEFYIVLDSDGEVDTVYYKFKFTARQAEQEWGETGTLPKSVVDALNSDKKEDADKEFEFIQELVPREDFDSFPAVATRRPIASTYVGVKDKAIVFEDGFYEMPKLTPRWYVNSNETNGRSQAMFGLPWIKLINQVIKDWQQGTQLKYRPPTLTPDDGFVGPIRYTPGALWHYRASYAANANAIRQLPTAGDSNEIKDMIEWVETNIKKAFFNDLFVMLAQLTGTQTAFEISERIQEKHSRVVAPIGRIQTELLNGVISRDINILGRAGKLRKIIAPELLDQGYEIQYVSKLALALRIIEVRSITATYDVVDRIGERNPQVFDNFNDDETARGVADRYGMPPDMMNSPEKVEEIREIRAAEEAAREAAELMIEASKAAPGISKEVEEGSILKEMAEAVG